MRRPTWHVLRVGGKHALPAVEIDGPAFDDLVRHLAEILAASIHDGDARADAWSDYVIAMSNQAGAIEHGVEDIGMEQLNEAVDQAWRRLVPELPRTVRVGLAEARMLAGALDDVAGRIGTVAA